MLATTLTFTPVKSRPDLVPQAVFHCLERIHQLTATTVAEIHPAHTSAADVAQHYGIPVSSSANCVIVEAHVSNTSPRYAAILAPADARIDFNGTVRRALSARRVSFAPLDAVLAATGMEHGSITPIGLPDTWSILIDASLFSKEHLLIGGGFKRSKIYFPASALHSLPNVHSIPSLTRPA